MIFVRNNKLILLVLLVTLLKGAVWAYVVPPFQAPDEQVHYAEIQHYAEPAGYITQDNNFPLSKTTLFDIDTQNLSPELKHYLERADFEQTRFDPKVKADFADHLPFRDQEPAGDSVNRFDVRHPAWLTNYPPFYYEAGAAIENAAAPLGVADKSFFIRLLSVLLTTVFVLSAYLIFRELNLAKTSAALLAATVSFQPMLTFIGASINVDALLFAGFGIFLWGAVRILKKIEWMGVAALLVGTIVSVAAKPSGYFALFALPAFAILLLIKYYPEVKKWERSKKIFWGNLAGLIIILAIGGLYIFYAAIKAKFFAGHQSLHLLLPYVAHQFAYAVFLGHSWFYWGNFGWLSLPIHRYYAYFLWVVMALAILGVSTFLFQKLRNWKQADQSEKIFFYQTLFLLFCVLGFFFMIHAVNFQQVNPRNVADETNSIAIQGRYLFPVMAAKFFLIYLGLATLFGRIKKIRIATFLLAGMVLLNTVSLLVYVIPRYYF
jgi:hypothetical protein